MRAYHDPGEQPDAPRRKKQGDTETASLFDVPAQPKKEREPHAPHQVTSATSKMAAERVSHSPVFAGNKRTCFLAIASASTDITRKRIAELYFDRQMQNVTGPIAQLIEEGFVYEEPERDERGAIRTKDGKVVPRRVDHSAVLKLTPRGKAAAGAIAA